MKNQWLTELEDYLTCSLESIVHVPYRVVCTYYEKVLRVTLINLDSGKSYLIATVRGKKTAKNYTFIEYFYVMPHFQGCGIGRTLLDRYTQIQRQEGDEEVHLKPLPFTPESRDPVEYIRLSSWLGGKDYVKMTRRQLVRFYQSAGFEALTPGNLESEMQKVLYA